jgi:hypothetical protein
MLDVSLATHQGPIHSGLLQRGVVHRGAIHGDCYIISVRRLGDWTQARLLHPPPVSTHGVLTLHLSRREGSWISSQSRCIGEGGEREVGEPGAPHLMGPSGSGGSRISPASRGSPMGTSLSGTSSSSEDSCVAAWDTMSSGRDVEGIVAGLAMRAANAASAACSARC